MMAAAKVLRPRSESSSSLGSRSSVLSARSDSSGLSGSSKGRSPSPEKAKDKEKKTKDKDTKSKSGTTSRGKEKKDGKAATNDHFDGIANGTPYAKLGSLKDCGDVHMQVSLVVKKLKACQQLYDFSRDDKQPEKEAKRLTLLEVLEWLPSVEDKDKDKDKKKDKEKDKSKRKSFESSVSNDSDDLKSTKLGKAIIEAVVAVAKANCFRTLQHRERTPMDLLDGEDEEPLLSPTWPHLEPIYEILLKIFSGKDLDAGIAQAAGMDKDFLTGLLDLFESDDPREREILKTIMIKFFNRLSPLRSAMRKGIQTFCLRAVYLDDSEAPQSGLAEVLDVLGSRVVGAFATPLKEEHRDVLLKVLLPLYKLDTLMFFYSQLKELVRMFIRKDNQLVKPVIVTLLRFWPISVNSKQTIFISELEDMVLALPSGQFRDVASPVVKRLAACIAQPSSEVSERALQFFRNSQLVRLTVQNGRDEMAGVISALYGNVTQAWTTSVLTKTLEVLKNFMEAEPELFDNSSSKHRKEAEEIDKREAVRQKRWSQLQAMHAKNRTNMAGRPKSRAKKSVIDGSRTGLHFNEDCRVKRESSLAVALCWNYSNQTQKRRLVLQAYVANTDGKILDGVHERNITALQSAVRLTHRAPAVAATKSDCSGTVWASLDLMPVDIALVVYVVTSPEGQPLGDIARDAILSLELNGSVSMGEIALDIPREAHMGIVAVAKRRESSGWSFIPRHDYTKNSWHAADFPDLLAKMTREFLPNLQKRTKPMASFTVMEKGSVADFPVISSHATSKIFIGMGWDFFLPEETAKIDVSLVLMSFNGKHVGTVSRGNPDGISGAFHTGDGALSAGIFLEPDALPDQVSVIFVVGHIDSDEQTFECVQQPHMSVIESTGKEISRFSMAEDDSHALNGVIMSRIFWNQFQDRWSCQALGVFTSGRTWRESLDVMLSIVHKPPSSFQTLLIEDEDHTVKGTPSTVASGYSVCLSI